MLARLRQIRRDERGMTFVFVGLGFLAFLSATTLAIDVGMMMVARSQAQNSADAGALAGATALVLNSFTDLSAGGPAVSSAVSTSAANQVISAPVSVGPADVSFPTDPTTGQKDEVKVNVYRTAARGNAVPTLVGRLFGVQTVDIVATATAEAWPADSASCMLPFTVPDKWTERSDGQGKPDGPWSPTKTFDLWYAKGSNQNGGAPLPNPDVYVPPGQTGYTGFNPSVDVGTQMVLKSNNQNKISPSIYNPFELGSSTGASDYENNIANCNPTIVREGDFLTPQTGNMVGPTSQGIDALIAKDPDAQWSTSCNNGTGCIMRDGIQVTSSPRISMIPLYDPNLYANGQQSGKSQPQLKVTNLLGFFIEGVNNNGDVTGRIVPAIALNSGNTKNSGGFARVIRLIQ